MRRIYLCIFRVFPFFKLSLFVMCRVVSSHSCRDLYPDDEENQPVLRMRRITTPAYALKRIDRHFFFTDYNPRSSCSSSSKSFMFYTVKKEEDLTPNPNSPHFVFTGHQHLYPYRFYLDLISELLNFIDSLTCFCDFSVLLSA